MPAPLTTASIRTALETALAAELSVYVLPPSLGGGEYPSIWAGEPPQDTKIKTALVNQIEYPVGGGVECVVLKTPFMTPQHTLSSETSIRRRFTVLLRQWDQRKGLENAIAIVINQFTLVDFGGLQPAQDGRLEQANLYVRD